MTNDSHSMASHAVPAAFTNASSAASSSNLMQAFVILSYKIPYGIHPGQCAATITMASPKDSFSST